MNEKKTWDNKKNEWLKAKRGVSFEIVAKKIMEGDIITILKHPNKEKYPNQKLFVLAIKNYPHFVPFIEEKESIFLKTIIPDRRYKSYVKD